MDPIRDIFSDNAFSVANLRKIVKNVQFVPQFLTGMGLFAPKPLVGTDKVIIYEEDGTLRMIPTTERYGPDTTQERDIGRMFALQTVRLSKKDTVRASELFGIADSNIDRTVRLRSAAQLLVDRLGVLKSERAMTLEHMMLGAIQGKLLDADGVTVIYDYYDEFDVAPPVFVEVDFANTAEEELTIYFQDTFFRPIIRSLKDRKTPTMKIGALVGDEWWAEMLKHPGFRHIYELMITGRAIANAQNPLLAQQAWMEVEFAGVRWINYMGTDDGTTIAIGADEAHFFPIGARDVFDIFYGPGETMLDWNQPGREEYVYIQPDVRTQMPSFVDFYLRSYPLPACIYPKALMRARLP